VRHEWVEDQGAFDRPIYHCIGIFGEPPEEQEDAAQSILDSRLATYGDRVTNMEAAAMMVNGYLAGVEVRTGSREITGADFAAIMALYKIYRFAVTPDYADNSDDVMGYMKIAIECVGDRMIHARTAEEYQEQKNRRQADEYELLRISIQDTPPL